MEKIIITVLGQDRPGIIAAVSQSLFEQDCNIENISQMVLQSEFAGLFVITAPEGATIEGVRESLNKALAAMNLEVQAKALTKPQIPASTPAVEPFLITTMGPDAKGLVARITAVLAKHGANVTNFKAVFHGGQNPDRNIMVYEVDVPADGNREALYAGLREKAKELGLEIIIQHRDIFDAVNKI
ncbi:ACT domain-containing protein [Desulfatibacillum aliphaticivorans]|uniref:ACT domain-containing protein n=1 Tax=Desulfatibacillum aliphaticivorans TaxID=218208 RepID=B8FJF6_DESAL|nr:ACT domain-containing protein [Desulfatibacillum aliphaticivorans]ACL05625.1 ACT domain-containing protein [Desulfatibacillum aliphaticivorans]